jgi:hypothetical protein
MTASACPSSKPRSALPEYQRPDLFHANECHGRPEQGVAGQGRLLFQQAGPSGVYYPETLKSMRAAFDLAWRHVCSKFQDREGARHWLAVQILHHVNRGEHNVGRIATSAADDLLALEPMTVAPALGRSNP